jgi:hypothetical protein
VDDSHIIYMINPISIIPIGLVSISIVFGSAAALALGLYTLRIIAKKVTPKRMMDLSTFQIEAITKVLDSEMCIVGTFPHSPHKKALLILQTQKFAQGNATRLLQGLHLRQVHANDVYSNHIGVFSGNHDAFRVRYSRSWMRAYHTYNIYIYIYIYIP